MAALGPLWVRDPLGPRARPLPLPPGDGSVLCLRRDRARQLVSAGALGGPPASGHAAQAARGPGPPALRPLRHPNPNPVRSLLSVLWLS